MPDYIFAVIFQKGSWKSGCVSCDFGGENNHVPLGFMRFDFSTQN